MRGRKSPSGSIRTGAAAILSLGILVLAGGVSPVGGLGIRTAATSVSTYQSWTTVGCGNATTLVAPTWHPHPRTGVLGGNATARTCASSSVPGYPNSSGLWGAYWILYDPISLLPNRSNDHVNATWALSWSVRLTDSVTSRCAGTLRTGASYGFLDCGVASTAEMELVADLYDGTTGVYYAPTTIFFPSLYNASYELWDRTCRPNCTTFHSSAPVLGASNGSLRFRFSFGLSSVNPADAWYLIAYCVGAAYAQVDTSSGNFTAVRPLVGSANAVFDMGGPGLGATLARLTVT